MCGFSSEQQEARASAAFMRGEQLARAIEAEGKVVWGLDVARFGNDRTALGRRWHTSQPCPACHAVSGGTRICWPGDFAAWWRTKLKRKLGKTEQIKKIRVG